MNSCSQGALSIDVQEALSSFVDSWHEHGSPWERWVAEVERLRGAFAALIGADPEEVAVMPSASAAIGAVATIRSTDAPELVRRLARRGVIGSARDSGLRVSFHAYNDDGDVDAVLDALDSEDTLVSQSA